ncbi:MAG: AAA family ATPase [Magnetococcales bacterium]|nr:AAA family ATPase [Magnetococcales bacterium]
MITVVGNLKGGSGKSTVTFNLAVWLARRGADVVAFDLDSPQYTLSDVVEIRDEDQHDPPVRIFRADSDPVRELRRHTGGEALVDVGGANNWAMRQAVRWADRVLVPVPPSQADVFSTQKFLKLVVESLEEKEERGGGKEFNRPELLLFINRADTHPGLRETEETLEALRLLADKFHGVQVMNHRLCQRTVYRRSFSEGKAVFELEPNNKAVEEFERFAAELYPHHAQQTVTQNKTGARLSAASA